MGLKKFWKMAELVDSDMLFQNQPTVGFGWTPTYFFFYFWKNKSCFLRGFTHKTRFAGCRIAPKWPKMDQNGLFWHFFEKSTTAANNGSKIVSRVLFWYPEICATQKHLRTSISASNNDLVSFLKPKIVNFGVFLGKFQHPQKSHFFCTKTPFYP